MLSQQPVNLDRCPKSPSGKHTWLTTYRIEGSEEVHPLPHPTCAHCLEIDEREKTTND